MKLTYIYTLSDPRNNMIRYVGKSDKPKTRYSSHICINSEQNHRIAWNKGLADLEKRKEHKKAYQIMYRARLKTLKAI